MLLAPPEFTEWFNGWLKVNGLGVREAARKIGISHPMVSDLQNAARPTEGTCVKLAIAANVPTDYVLSLAGYLPKLDEHTVLLEQAKHLFNALKTERFRNIALSVIEKLVEQEESEQISQKKQADPLQPVGKKP